MKYILVLSAAALITCGSIVEGSDSTKVRVKDDTIYYQGELQAAANQRMKKLYDRARHKPIWKEGR